jgi:hypothetical protein
MIGVRTAFGRVVYAVNTPDGWPRYQSGDQGDQPCFARLVAGCLSGQTPVRAGPAPTDDATRDI